MEIKKPERKHAQTRKVNKKLCVLLKNYREFCSLTQQQVATTLGIDRSTYTYYENGKTTPSISTLMELIKMLNIPYDEFLDCVNHAETDMTPFALDDYVKHLNEGMHSNDKEGIYELTDDEQQLLISYRILRDSDKVEILKNIHLTIRDNKDKM